ncbi:NUDIX hydrolase [Enterococcus sp. DIV0876]|uniref:NUDIX hydrolase n=1 Tax=Enterococcus sp. DIV0876 TaxID=2774633 RepID=UPI003D300C0B
MDHLAFGVYGILIEQNCLAVIKKNGGPYTNRYDLPGGSLADGELLEACLYREFKEETGLMVEESRQLGTVNFLYPWTFQLTTMNNHICVFYEITRTQGKMADIAQQFDGQDSLGACFVSFDHLNEENASPLVLKAKEFHEEQVFKATSQRFSQWEVKRKPMFGATRVTKHE